MIDGVHLMDTIERLVLGDLRLLDLLQPLKTPFMWKWMRTPSGKDSGG
jgi:hypothetical protein